MRSVWALIWHPSRQNSFLPFHQSYPHIKYLLGRMSARFISSARWRKYSESDKPHVLAISVTFSFLGDAHADIDSNAALSHAPAASQGFGAVPVGFSAGCPVATLRPCLLSLRDLCDANDADDAVCEISHLKAGLCQFQRH